jgi:hypothetical protein
MTDELKDLVLQLLEEKGVLNKIRVGADRVAGALGPGAQLTRRAQAELRKHVFAVIEQNEILPPPNPRLAQLRSRQGWLRCRRTADR